MPVSKNKRKNGRGKGSQWRKLTAKKRPRNTPLTMDQLGVLAGLI